MNTTMLRLALLIPCLATLAVPALAQEQVTVIKRDGERITGRFEDWTPQNDTVYVRVSLHDQRRFPMRDVLVIDVQGQANSLPRRETEAAAGADDVLVLRDGQLIRGHLTDIEGGEGSGNERIPRTVTFDASRGERRYRMSEVARLYLGHYPDTTYDEGRDRGWDSENRDRDRGRGRDWDRDRDRWSDRWNGGEERGGAIRVSAQRRWTPTGIWVTRGERVAFWSEGEVRLSNDRNDWATTAGSATDRHARWAPVPYAPSGALIGRIGNGEPFPIGDQRAPLPVPASGELYLGVNDDELSDNAGGFVVTPRVWPGSR